MTDKHPPPIQTKSPLPETSPKRFPLLQPEGISFIELLVIRVFLLTKLVSELVAMATHLQWQ